MALRGFTWGVKPRSGAPRPIDPLRRPVSTGAAGGGPTIGEDTMTTVQAIRIRPTSCRPAAAEGRPHERRVQHGAARFGAAERAADHPDLAVRCPGTLHDDRPATNDDRHQRGSKGYLAVSFRESPWPPAKVTKLVATMAKAPSNTRRLSPPQTSGSEAVLAAERLLSRSLIFSRDSLQTA